MRAVIWVQHLLGTGHTVRAAAIGHALAARGAEVTMVLGADPPATVDLAGLEVVALAPVRALDASFGAIAGPDGTPYAALVEARTRAFEATVAAVRPHVVLTETFPVGRRPFAAEILPVLAALPSPRPLVAASVRDVLVRKPPDKEAAMARLARDWFDLVLVHADPEFVTLGESFSAADTIADLVRYTGFVHSPPPARDGGDGAGEVVVSSGGGCVGSALVEAALGAARALGPSVRWRVLVPAAMGGRLAGWQDAAPAHVAVEANRSDFRALLARAALSVSQAGYNTALDVMAAGVRAVFVPFAAHDESEQTDRARALQARGLATVLGEADLSADALATAVRAALSAPPPPPLSVDLDGAARTAEILLEAVR